MGAQIATLRDDFFDNAIATAWDTFVSGSATVAETGGQFVVTLPSSTAGTHYAGYSSHSAYNLTGDEFYINIATMVSTAVAATAYYELRLAKVAQTNVLRWTQTSNTLKAQTVVAGVTTDQYSVTWSGTTYKYLRISESGGNILFQSSTNGTSWTTRATVAVSGLFAVTDLYVVLFALCGMSPAQAPSSWMMSTLSSPRSQPTGAGSRSFGR